MTDNIPEIRSLLKKEWHTLTKYMKDAAQKRDEFLAQFINQEDSENAESSRKALIHIRRREQAKSRYDKIRVILISLEIRVLKHLDVHIYEKNHNIIG